MRAMKTTGAAGWSPISSAMSAGLVALPIIRRRTRSLMSSITDQFRPMVPVEVADEDRRVTLRAGRQQVDIGPVWLLGTPGTISADDAQASPRRMT